MIVKYWLGVDSLHFSAAGLVNFQESDNASALLSA